MGRYKLVKGTSRLQIVPLQKQGAVLNEETLNLSAGSGTSNVIKTADCSTHTLAQVPPEF
jgi:hypothetical protein